MAQRNYKKRTDDQVYGDWVSWIERAYKETIAQGWRHRMFRLLRGIYAQNPELQQTGGFFLQWAADNYVAAAAMSFRRELDTQPGTENLHHILTEMLGKPHVICRRRFRSTWTGDLELYTADRAFDSLPHLKHADDRDLDYLDPASVIADVQSLRMQDKVLQHVQVTYAHRVPEQANAEAPTFAEFHQAIRVVSEVFKKYYAILTHRTLMTIEPVAQYNVYVPFRNSWIRDAEGFDYSQAD